MLDADRLSCARLLEQGDPLRFRCTMAAPPALRAVLFPLYAFNVEVSRAPWVTQETMIAEMRLQWWRDALEEIAAGGPVRRHEVTTPLSEVLSAEDAMRLDAAVAARRWDIYRDAFEDAAHFEAYIDQTAGHLMWTAAKLTSDLSEAPVRAMAYAQGVAAFLRAIPALEAAGRIPLLDGSQGGVRALAQGALDRLADAPKHAPAALWPAIGVRKTLRQVVADPGIVADGQMHPGLTHWGLLRASLLRWL